jgi:hypothetical protein
MYGIRAIYFKRINKSYKNNCLDISQAESSMMAMARVVRLRVQSKFSPIVTSTHLFSMFYGYRNPTWKCPVFQQNHKMAFESPIRLPQRHPPDTPVRLDAGLHQLTPAVARPGTPVLPALADPRVPANSRPLTALERAALVLYAASDPSVAQKAKPGEFVTCLAPFDLLQSPINRATQV